MGARIRRINEIRAARFDLARTGRRLSVALAVLLFASASLMTGARCARAQDADAGSEMNGLAPMTPPSEASSESGRLAPMPRVPLRQPISGTMMVSPPYGNAPLRVGFFVLASDPENIGFLTYQWNFGDGTVSSLPPEMYIFHTYSMPGNYVCTLIVKTVDGRSMTILQGVVVKPVQD
ncbi:MAG TPA: PKD domain-containing protein [Candidatus Binataceae bacterium]|nr:PKD domain-containing protein [Candidatus Binataceae bacterium]